MQGEFVTEFDSRTLILLACAFLLSAFSGLAWLLRSPRKLTYRSQISAMLNSGLCGLILALIWFKAYRGDTLSLLGICGLAGIGGVATVDVVAALGVTVVNRLFGDKFGQPQLDDSGQKIPKVKSKADDSRADDSKS